MSGYVYFFETGDGLMKIGKANNVAARFKQIQTSCPTGLTKIGSIQSDEPYTLEKKIHKKFKKYRKSGEWFDLPSYLKADIVHKVLMEFDADYKAEYLHRKREEEFNSAGFIATDEDWQPSACASCGSESHNLVGIYDMNADNSDYDEVATVVSCQYCDQLYGNFESHGKGGKFTGRLIVRQIPDDWSKLL